MKGQRGQHTVIRRVAIKTMTKHIQRIGGICLCAVAAADDRLDGSSMWMEE